MNEFDLRSKTSNPANKSAKPQFHTLTTDQLVRMLMNFIVDKLDISRITTTNFYARPLPTTVLQA